MAKNRDINNIMSGLQNQLGGNRPMTKPAPDGAKPEYTTQLRPGGLKKPGPANTLNQAAPPVLGGGAETFTGPRMPAASLDAFNPIAGGARPMPKPGAPTGTIPGKPRPRPMPMPGAGGVKKRLPKAPGTM